MPEQMVLTHGGFRPASQVHHIETDKGLDLASNRIRKVNRNGEVTADFGQLAESGPNRHTWDPALSWKKRGLV
jgi:hypothetical protein